MNGFYEKIAIFNGESSLETELRPQEMFVDKRTKTDHTERTSNYSKNNKKKVMEQDKLSKKIRILLRAERMIVTFYIEKRGETG